MRLMGNTGSSVSVRPLVSKAYEGYIFRWENKNRGLSRKDQIATLSTLSPFWTDKDLCILHGHCLPLF
jgi:hypothetical protein